MQKNLARRRQMSNELFERLRLYCEAISVIRRMKEAGLINEEEFCLAEVHLAQKYGFSQWSILREIT